MVRTYEVYIFEWKNYSTAPVIIREEQANEVQNFQYLRSRVCQDGSVTEEIRRRSESETWQMKVADRNKTRCLSLPICLRRILRVTGRITN